MPGFHVQMSIHFPTGFEVEGFCHFSLSQPFPLLWSVRQGGPWKWAKPVLILVKINKEMLSEVGCSQCSPADPPLLTLWCLSKALGSLKTVSV